MLAEAIQCLRDSVTAAPADHPSRAGHLYNLGNAFLELSKRTGDTAAVAAAASCFTQAADNAGARAAVRILAYCSVAELAGRARRIAAGCDSPRWKRLSGCCRRSPRAP